MALDALDAPDVDEGENVIEGVIANESPFASLATNVKPGWWFMEVIDMERRLLLTCFPLVFTTYGGVVLFTLCIALLARAGRPVRIETVCPHVDEHKQSH